MDIALTEFGASLKKRGERFVITREGKEPVEVPAEEVSRILLIGRGISMSVDALHLAAERGASVSLLTFSGRPVAEFVGVGALDRTRRRKEQLRASEDARGVRIAKGFVAGKLRNQIANLRYFGKSRKENAPELHAALAGHARAIETLAGQVEAVAGAFIRDCRAVLMNIEARAAQAYWAGLRALLPEDLGFVARVRQGASDPFNVCLNYGYGILYSRGWNAVVGAGLDPYAGFLHADRDGEATLVFDFIEMFRPYTVDRPVMALFTKRWRPELDGEGALEAGSRRHLAARVLEQFYSTVEQGGRAVSVEAAMTAQAYRLATAIEGDGQCDLFGAPW